MTVLSFSRSLVLSLLAAGLIAGCGDSSEPDPSTPPGEDNHAPGDCNAPKEPEALSVASLYAASDAFLHGRVASIGVSFDEPERWDSSDQVMVQVDASECEEIRPIFVATIEPLNALGLDHEGDAVTVYFGYDTLMDGGFEHATNDGIGVRPNDDGEFVWASGTMPFGIQAGDEIAAFLHRDDASGRLAVLSTHESIFRVEGDILSLVDVPERTYYCGYPGDYESRAAFAELSGLSVDDALALLTAENVDDDAVSSYLEMPLGHYSSFSHAAYCWLPGAR